MTKLKQIIKSLLSRTVHAKRFTVANDILVHVISVENLVERWSNLERDRILWLLFFWTGLTFLGTTAFLRRSYLFSHT